MMRAIKQAVEVNLTVLKGFNQILVYFSKFNLIQVSMGNTGLIGENIEREAGKS
jgi:Mlc titration factor MtfA (ptsG expression regulator)